MGKEGEIAIDRHMSVVDDLHGKDPIFTDVLATSSWLIPDIEQLKEKSDWKFDHTVRIAQMGLSLARQQGLTDEDQQTLVIATYIHDIKMVDDDLLSLTNMTAAEGKLTDEELKLLRTHPQLAYEAYKEKNEQAALLARDHDKTPEAVVKLLPEHLQSLHTILYTCDQVDARLSDRPYKELKDVQTEEQVKTELQIMLPLEIIERAITARKVIFSDASEQPEAS